MKKLTYRQLGDGSSKALLEQILRNSGPNMPMGIVEMGQRWDLIKKLRASTDDIVLANDEHMLMRRAFETCGFTMVQEDALAVYNDIKEAPDVPTPEK